MPRSTSNATIEEYNPEKHEEPLYVSDENLKRLLAMRSDTLELNPDSFDTAISVMLNSERSKDIAKGTSQGILQSVVVTSLAQAGVDIWLKKTELGPRSDQFIDSTTGITGAMGGSMLLASLILNASAVKNRRAVESALKTAALKQVVVDSPPSSEDGKEKEMQLIMTANAPTSEDQNLFSEKEHLTRVLKQSSKADLEQQVLFWLVNQKLKDAQRTKGDANLVIEYSQVQEAVLKASLAGAFAMIGVVLGSSAPASAGSGIAISIAAQSAIASSYSQWNAKSDVNCKEVLQNFKLIAKKIVDRITSTSPSDPQKDVRLLLENKPGAVRAIVDAAGNYLRSWVSGTSERKYVSSGPEGLPIAAISGKQNPDTEVDTIIKYLDERIAEQAPKTASGTTTATNEGTMSLKGTSPIHASQLAENQQQIPSRN